MNILDVSHYVNICTDPEVIMYCHEIATLIIEYLHNFNGLAGFFIMRIVLIVHFRIFALLLNMYNHVCAALLFHNHIYKFTQ